MTLAESVDSAHGAAPTEVRAKYDHVSGYMANIEEIRAAEYPMLQGTTYLDHAGTTLYAKSLIEAFSRDMTSNLFGNPHSASTSSRLSSRTIDDTRLKLLQFFAADPDEFDVVFVANATAAIKLVADAFRDHDSGFWYGFHADAHTSLVGVRELAKLGSRCFRDDQEVDSWISRLEMQDDSANDDLMLFAYPGQSNMTGYRPPMEWCKSLRSVANLTQRRVYSLYDAAGLVSTSPLDLSDASAAPDFISISLYKIFGFPDLGALIVRKSSGVILHGRKFFGGGTVDMVVPFGNHWHAKKLSSLHSRLEDGTVPFHNIIALGSALSVHERIYGSMKNISRHTSFLARRTFEALSSMHHSNGIPVCEIYRPSTSEYGNLHLQGATLAFNLRDSRGGWVGKSEVEKLATVKDIQFRSGTLCSPGAIAKSLHLSSEEMKRNFAAGQRCGDENDVIDGKPTGAIRISFGAMSSLSDMEKFVAFIEEFYVEKSHVSIPAKRSNLDVKSSTSRRYFIQSLSVYPIKSCGAYKVPPNVRWEIKEEGLAWDREWCLVHQGTGVALSQKRYPRMTLLHPVIDVEHHLLTIFHDIEGPSMKRLDISLARESRDRRSLELCDRKSGKSSNVCGEQVEVQIYNSSEVATFFSEALGVPCTLARCPPRTAHRIGRPRRPRSVDNGRGEPDPKSGSIGLNMGKPILLSNESPILLISRSSVNRLNEHIKANSWAGRAVSADSFRGNIVIAEELAVGQRESPYAEDNWKVIRIGYDDENMFEVLGPCQRCQMVCVDQKSAEKWQEPFTTLAKTRRRDGKVWFGMHLSLGASAKESDTSENKGNYVRIGDPVTTNPT